MFLTNMYFYYVRLNWLQSYTQFSWVHKWSIFSMVMSQKPNGILSKYYKEGCRFKMSHLFFSNFYELFSYVELANFFGFVFSITHIVLKKVNYLHYELEAQ